MVLVCTVLEVTLSLANNFAVLKSDSHSVHNIVEDCQQNDNVLKKIGCDCISSTDKYSVV